MNKGAFTRLSLLPRTWYGWQMLPGYTDAPYFSPILVHEVRPLKTGNSILELSFFNACYAQGAQDFNVRMKVLKREDRYLVGELLDDPHEKTDRCAIIASMSFEWLRSCCPLVLESYPPQRSAGDGQGVATYLNAIMNRQY